MKIAVPLLLTAIAGPAWAQADAIMQRARHEIAEMSREPDRNPAPHGNLLSSALQARLDRRFAVAHAAARPRWYQPARIDEITTAGDGTARTYRITTAVGSYCMTYPKDGGRPTYGLCNESGP
jgi:hypothetical protein